jgi:hypothetical protein
MKLLGILGHARLFEKIGNRVAIDIEQGSCKINIIFIIIIMAMINIIIIK